MAQETPIWFVVLTMDYCSRTFGNSPCLATGEKCFNTFPTCKYLSAYNATTKDYRFTSADAPAPFDNARPYVIDVKLLPTEIKTTLTVSGRVTVKFADEPDKDIGIDPYVTSRSAFPNIPGTFWKKWIRRNRNYKGRTFSVYEGWNNPYLTTNLLLRSEELGTTWSAGRVTISSDSIASPTGTLTADKMTETVDNNTHRVEQSSVSGTDVTKSFTLSAYLKAGTRTTAALWMTDSTGTNQIRGNFNLASGSPMSSVNQGSAKGAASTLVSLGGGWYRASVTGIVGGTGSVYAFIAMTNGDDVVSYTGSTSNYLYAWGAQLEIGGEATTYVPTTSASATNTVEGTYIKRWQGRIDNVTLNKSEVTIEAVDRLKDLSKVEVPPKIDSKLNGAIDAVATTLLVTNPTNLPSSGYLIVDEEVMSYSSRDTGTGIVSGLSRGLYSTTAAAHNDKTKVGLVKVYGAQNAFDLMKSILLTDAAMPSGEVDSTAFDTARDFFNTDDLNVQGIITEPTKLDKLYFELVDLFECKSWVGENLKVTIARNIPYDPARSLTTFSDSDNIIHESASADLNEKGRITRVILYWEKTPAGKLDEPVSYGRVDIAVDTTAESASEYGEVLSKTLYSRWITTSGYQEEFATAFARRLVMRKVWVNRDAMPLLKVEAAFKDEGMKTGDFLSVTTDELLDKFGVAYTGITFQIVRRERKGSKIGMTLQQVLPHKVGYIHATVSPNEWASATDTEKKYAYICADDSTLPTDVDGYYIY